MIILLTNCGGKAMKWNTPKVLGVSVGLEINSYACAEV